MEIDNTRVKDASHVVKLLNQIQDREVNIVIERNKIRYETKIKPIKSIQDNCYRMGIWVRDKTAGIGTLTFMTKIVKFLGGH